MSADSPELTIDGLRHLGNVPRLRYLSLRGPLQGPINDAMLDSLHQLDVLEWLELGHPNGAMLTDITSAAVIRSARLHTYIQAVIHARL